jgi:hypothetical protein
MHRRSFLKALGLSPLAPIAAEAMPAVPAAAPQFLPLEIYIPGSGFRTVIDSNGCRIIHEARAAENVVRGLGPLSSPLRAAPAGRQLRG